jgi:hypothetical protein
VGGAEPRGNEMAGVGLRPSIRFLRLHFGERGGRRQEMRSVPLLHSLVNLVLCLLRR